MDPIRLTTMQVGDIDTIYLAGLLHDDGKFLHKYGNAKISHRILSQVHLLAHKDIAPTANIKKAANIIVNHHSGNKYYPEANSELAPGLKIAQSIIDEASDNYDDNYPELRKYLVDADSLSAASDRASENNGNTKDGRFEFAPLLSPLGSITGSRIAVRHGHSYATYEYSGTSEKADVLEVNDPGYLDAIAISAKRFEEGLDKVRSIEELDDLTKTHWSTVNPNTWRPEGSEMGNTYTSLYDHCKTTAAIAVCLYINESKGYPSDMKNPNIDIIRVKYNGINADSTDITSKILSLCRLRSLNVIGQFGNISYIMIPACITRKVKELIREENKEYFRHYGEVVDFDLAPAWQFRNCQDSLEARFTEHYHGILDIIKEKVAPPANLHDKHDIYSTLFKDKDVVVAGFAVNNFDSILSAIIGGNDSISRFSTTLRIFESFINESAVLLERSGCTVLDKSFDMLIYAAPKEKLYALEYDGNPASDRSVYSIFTKYACLDETSSDGSMCKGAGLTFSYRKFDRYGKSVDDIISKLKEDQQKYSQLTGPDAFTVTRVSVNGRMFGISCLRRYREFKHKCLANMVSSSTMYKILELYKSCLSYNPASKNKGNADPSCLISYSRLSKLIQQQAKRGNNPADTELLNDARKCLLDQDKQKINPNAHIFYEAVYDAAHKSSGQGSRAGKE